MAVIPSTPPPTKPFRTSRSEMETVENRNEVVKSESKDLGNSSVKRRRNRYPGVRKIGNRIYDPKIGNTCHQVINVFSLRIHSSSMNLFFQSEHVSEYKFYDFLSPLYV